MSSFGTLPVARLRVIGAMTRRFCSASGPREDFENSSDIMVFLRNDSVALPATQSPRRAIYTRNRCRIVLPRPGAKPRDSRNLIPVLQLILRKATADHPG